ncbi:NUDIX hydrolase [Leucobacter sp. CSA1]|uniref:NUDIX hydrolase n=1 Tax=Leucobacter chromiisoli TaxID=2796471 RepID=A0A934UVV1_9MICO|nr:NUDIX hydrolase [Leucobacter chromiisoli]MBK0419886.1 NUDIX hydrolase [Leucobacter chromiisoli]
MTSHERGGAAGSAEPCGPVEPAEAPAEPAEAPAELADAPAEVPILASELIARGRVWDVRRDRFEFGGAELVRDYVDHPGAVAVLAVDSDERVLLIRQYRHAIAHRDWEIPAGLMDVAGESGLAGAQRELVEEADLVAGRWDLLVDVCTTPGGNSEAVRIFLARDLGAVEHDYVREGEEAEMVLRWEPLDAVVDAVLAGRVQNAITANAVLAAAASRARGWATLRPADTPWNRRAAVRGERSAS